MGYSYEDWHKKIQDTLAWRQKYWNGDKAWKRYLALYRGDHWRNSRYNEGFLSPDSDVPRDKITVNMTGSTVVLAKSFFLKGNPKFLISPKKFLDQSEVQIAIINARLQEEVLNYEYQDRNMHLQIKDAVLDDLIIGHGVTKTGFTFRDPIGKSPKKDGVIDTREYIEKGAPYIERVNPFRFLFDIENESFRQLDNVAWCAEIFFKNRYDVLANPAYDKGVISKIKDGTYYPEYYQSELTARSDYNFNKGDKESDLCVLYEVWDKKYKKYYIFMAGILEAPLLEKDWYYDYLDGFPYIKTDFIPMPNEHYGLGIPAWIEDQQLELNRVRTTMYDHRRRFNRKYTVIEGSMEPSEIEKLKTGDTGTILKVSQHNAVMPLQEGKIPSDAFAVEQTIKADIMELTGVDQLARGGQLPGRTSAAEINARQSYVNLKLDDRVADVDDFVKNNGKKTLQHIQANTQEDKVMRIVGPQGALWVNLTPADIKGEFDLDMDTISAPKQDEVAERQQRLQVFQLIMQNIQMIMQAKIPINIEELFRWLLESFGEKDISRFMAPSQALLQMQGGENTNGLNTNTALNLQSGNVSNNPPPVIDSSQLRAQLSGAQSGGGFNMNPSGGIQ